MATLTREQQIAQKEEQLLKLLGKRLGGGSINPEDLGFKKSDLMKGVGRLRDSFMSFTTFSPETTILNIAAQPELLVEYIKAIFAGMKKTTDNKVSHDLKEILDRISLEDSEKMLSSFIYDSVLYFHENPLTLSDSDSVYEDFKAAESISKKFVNGPYKIVKLDKETNPHDIDPKKLVKELANPDYSLSVKDVVTILKKLYGDSINFSDFTLKDNQ